MAEPADDPVVHASCSEAGALVTLGLDARTGRLTLRQVIDGLGRVMPLALRPDRRVLVAARRSEPCAALAWTRGPDGCLAPVGEAPLPASMAHLAIDATGRWLLAASYPGDCLAVVGLDAAGRPGAVVQVVPTGRHAHALVPSPDNRRAHAPILGADEVLAFGFDAQAGRLTPVAAARWRAAPGSGPRQIAWHPRRPVVALLHELDGTLQLLAVDPVHGGLTVRDAASVMPPGRDGTPWASELRFTPDGRFLFATERRTDTVAGFAVGADDRLVPIGHWPTEPQPRGLAIDPSGRWLVAAGERSHRLRVHAIDPLDGRLHEVDAVAVPDGPSAVEVAHVPPASD